MGSMFRETGHPFGLITKLKARQLAPQTRRDPHGGYVRTLGFMGRCFVRWMVSDVSK